ncbi:MAG: PAS domain S-box protein [Pedobacter sp.]|nr:MAG: PAS domain S-box protein [Pedobacter sp.]
MSFSFSNPNNYNIIVEASPSATAIYHGRDIVISAANQDMLNMWGKGNSVLGKPMLQALPELEGQPFIAILQQVYDTGITYSSKQDKARLVVDGELKTFYFNFTYKAIKDAEGNTEAIIHHAIDVTELVEARKKISETEERLTFALESAEIGTWDLNPIDQKVDWDKRCRELFGFDGPEEVKYVDVLKCIHPDDKDRVDQAVLAAIDPENPDTYDIRYRTLSDKNKILRWVHCKGRAYFNKQGIAFRFAGTAREITNEVNANLGQQQLLSLINYNADHMSIADMDGNVIYMNRAARKMLGISKEKDVTSMSAQDFYSPEELDRVQNKLIKEIDSKKGWQGVIYLKNQENNQQIPVMVNYMLIKNPYTGEVIGRGATARDLRPEIKARAELKRLATIVDISEDFCNYCDLKGNTIYMNEAGLRLIGLNALNIDQANLYDYHSEATSAKIKNVILPELLSTGKWSGTLELLHQITGEIIPIHKQLFIITEDHTNEPVAIAGIARDLRAEINAQKAMEKAMQEMEFLANAVPAVVWTSKPNGMLDYINQRWNERSDRSIEESLGNAWADTIHPDDFNRVLESWQKSLDTGNPYQIEFRLLDKDGEYRWWLVRAVALKDVEGKVIKWYGTNTDITEQKELQQQKDNFLAVASHELKTPVTSIKAYAQVLEMMLTKSGDTKNAALMSKMDTQLNRLTSLIGDLLDVTKINSGRLQFNNMPFDFNEMVNDIIEDIQLTSGRHQIRSQLGFKGMVTGDRDRIAQVVVNLLTNAIKYSPDADRIIVYTEDHGSEVQLCVQDFGIGLTRDKQDKVFEQFYRVSGTTEHTFPGLGLGLYISSEIIKQLGGKIWVNSVLGKGSTFCFAIPVSRLTN